MENVSIFKSVKKMKTKKQASVKPETSDKTLKLNFSGFFRFSFQFF